MQALSQLSYTPEQEPRMLEKGPVFVKCWSRSLEKIFSRRDIVLAMERISNSVVLLESGGSRRCD